jgi:hypothetical protein
MFDKDDQVTLTRGRNVLKGRILGLANEDADPLYYVLVETAVDPKTKNLSVAILKYRQSEMTRA